MWRSRELGRRKAIPSAYSISVKDALGLRRLDAALFVWPGLTGRSTGIGTSSRAEFKTASSRRAPRRNIRVCPQILRADYLGR